MLQNILLTYNYRKYHSILNVLYVWVFSRFYAVLKLCIAVLQICTVYIMSHTLMSVVTFIFISESYFLFINSRVLLLVVENDNFCNHNSIAGNLVLLYNGIHNKKSGIRFLIFMQVYFYSNHWIKIQFSSVTQSYLIHCDPVDCSTPSVHHQLTELAQTHVHHVGDAIQPSHPLSSPSPPTFSLSQHEDLFKWVSS